MSKEAFDRKLAEIGALRSAPEETAQEQLRKALKDRNNYAVAKAAAIVGDRGFEALAPDLVAAFDRFLANAAKSDPQCWAKNAIAKALKDLGHSEAEVFFRGTAHVQREGVWGGSQDTAATLRGTCALALVGSRALSFDILTRLTDLLGDPEMTVRIDAARAMAQLNAREGMLPLRLKALVGDREPEAIGQCFAALLSLGPRECLPFVAGFLQNEDADIRMEAAGALVESREAEAMDYLKQFWERQTDPAAKRTFLTLLAGSPIPAAADFLLSVVEDGSQEIATEALMALAKSRYRSQFKERAWEAVTGRGFQVLQETFKREWSDE